MQSGEGARFVYFSGLPRVSLHFHAKCVVLLAVAVDDELTVLDDLSAIEWCQFRSDLVDGIWLGADELHLVDVAVGSCDGEAQNLLTGREFLEEVACEGLVGAPVAVACL